MSTLTEHIRRPPPQATGSVLNAHFDRIADAIESVEAAQQTILRILSQRMAPIPKTRKYRYADAGIRITTGEDPARMSEERLAALKEQGMALSERSVRRLCADGDCPLTRIKIANNAFITEASIQHYEEGVRNGWVDAYQVKQPRRYRV